jgi:S-formylglutathione hydrolase FrmB
MRQTKRLVLLLFFISICAQAQSVARVQNVIFASRLIGKSLPYNVVLPPDYDSPRARSTRYPVLYLLHGLGGDANNWISNRAHLAQHAAQYKIIIVTPEGHDNWYTDSATVPTDKYESYIVQELIPDVERRFRTLTSREGRAIAGLSMGGYGSMKFGLKFPDRFIFAASMSGALPATEWDPADTRLPDWVKPSISKSYGPINSPARQANDIFKIASNVPESKIATLPFLYLDCGTEDMLVTYNRAFDDILLKRKIAHEYRELPGKHDWPYWDQQIQEVLKLASLKMAQPAMVAGVK